jgi:H+/Cl- antiporter ClcA
MQLATIKSPDNASLYEGSAILNNIGLSPLTLAALGILSRLLDSINKSKHAFVQQWWLRIIELIVLVGLILGIVGGVVSQLRTSSIETTLTDYIGRCK